MIAKSLTHWTIPVLISTLIISGCSTFGLGIAHDFALPSAGNLKRVMPDQLSLTRSFYLLRYKEDHRLERMNRLAQALVAGVRAEISRLEALA